MNKMLKSYLAVNTILVITILVITILFGCRKEEKPTIETLSATYVTGTTATSGGNITDEGSSAVIDRGVCWSTGNTPTIADGKTTDGSGEGSYTSNLMGLNWGTVYYVRAYATNSEGTGYGMALTFTTLEQSPRVTTLEATNINVTGATLNCYVNANYLSTVVTFEFGTTTNYGNTVTVTQSPLTGDTLTIVSSTITGLANGATYHFRVKAINSRGATYGNDMALTTAMPDVDGNIYNTITIGTQVWLKENLKTTKYNDGSPIPNITDNTVWNTFTGAYCDYNNTPSNSSTYGRLYNWYAVDNNAATKVASNSGKNVCPTGWHVAYDGEWTTLTDYLTNNGYGYFTRSDIAKSMAATSGWSTSGTPGSVGNEQESNNRSGFTALPGGSLFYNGSYVSIGKSGYWWSSSEYSTLNPWFRYMNSGIGNVLRTNGSKQDGFSVRCLRD
jgi:uncharacterized protein (TIGR02145 family)